MEIEVLDCKTGEVERREATPDEIAALTPPADPEPTEKEIERGRLHELKEKGWANLSAAEKIEVQRAALILLT